MKIVLDGVPISKERPRFAVRQGNAFVYDPQAQAKESVQWRISDAMRRYLDSDNKEEVMDASSLSRNSAFEVSFSFYLPLPKITTLAKKGAMLWGLVPCICKPDCDNLEKFYLDCGSGILWPDDRMVVITSSCKRYSEKPRTEITVNPIKNVTLKEEVQRVLTHFSPEDFNGFIKDAKVLSQLDIDSFFEQEDDVLELRISYAAELLASFANKYGKKLDKLNRAIENINAK